MKEGAFGVFCPSIPSSFCSVSPLFLPQVSGMRLTMGFSKWVQRKELGP